MNVYLVRHGETPHNRDGVTLGRADVPLSETGQRQAAALGERFAHVQLDRVYASPLVRARETATAIAGAKQIEVEVRDALIEMDVGTTEHLTGEELRERFPDFLAEWNGPSPARVMMPGGESLDHVNQRLGTFVPELLMPGLDAVAVVSHNFVLKVLLCRLLSLPVDAFRSFAVDVASVTTVVVRGERITLRALNDCCHLEGLNLDRGDRSV